MLLFALWSGNRADILVGRLELEFATIFAYVAALLLGVPLFVAVWRFRWLSFFLVWLSPLVALWLLGSSFFGNMMQLSYSNMALLTVCLAHYRHLLRPLLFWFIANASLTNRSRGTL